MTPELAFLKSRQLPEDLIANIAAYLGSGDPAIPGAATSSQIPWMASNAGTDLVRKFPWNENLRKIVRFFVFLSGGAPPHVESCHAYISGVLKGLMPSVERPGDQDVDQAVITEIESCHPAPEGLVERYLKSHHYCKEPPLADLPDADRPFVFPGPNFIYRHIGAGYVRMPEVFTSHFWLFPALLEYRPGLVEAWCAWSLSSGDYACGRVWKMAIDATSRFDGLCLRYCELSGTRSPLSSFRLLRHLDEARGGAHFVALLEAAAQPRVSVAGEALELLLRHRRPDVIEMMGRAFTEPKISDHMTSLVNSTPYQELFDLAISRWNEGGSRMIRNFLEHSGFFIAQALEGPLARLGPDHHPVLREALLARIAGGGTEVWEVIESTYPQVFIGEFGEMLVSKSKPARELAARALVRALGGGGIDSMRELLATGRPDGRLGACAFFERLADPATIPLLEEALRGAASVPLKEALNKALKACGREAPPHEVQPEFTSLAEVEASIAKQSAKLKLPGTSWLKADILPPLVANDGETLTPSAVAFLIATQSKHKTLDAAPDILPLLSHIDRERSAPFAAALVNGFLNSDQAAADRWALALGGLLGDKRIIPPLLSRIPDWCENSRHKLAEYAAQAISLLPGNEPLMVLDTLANRYRNKFKNVGKACADAFEAAAKARGITPDELGDLVVPDFGFDAEGIRRFEWEGGGASAELGADFKISWFDPETEKSWKALPASAPAAIKEEIKTLGKLLREAVKGQGARLEMALVRQRRWPVARWRELYEDHPLLRSFASQLAWGIYDASGSLLRLYRRYPNGLLANATGELEELPETDTFIGLVHPLELDAATLESWRAHLARFKVKQPFPQIDRPVELQDPLHGNRKEIALTRGKEVGAGTFKSRSEKRGWYRGSVVDAGGISSIYKPFPGAGYEAILPTGSYWVGIDPMDTVELEAAYFVRSGSVDRGSYTYDEPGGEDSRVLRFDEVPPVVWSETVADLKAIVGA